MRPAIHIERLCGHAAVVDRLGPDSVVVDVGASRGRFAQAAIERFGCRVLAVEPVEALFAALPAHPLLRTERLAVAATPGSATVFVGADDETATLQPELRAAGAQSEQVPAVTLGELLDRGGIEQASLVKLDVEGAELDVLDSVPAETLARIEQLSVEFHDFLVPEWTPRVLAVDRRLTAFGFYRLRVSRDRSDVLYVNLSLRPLTRLDRLWLLVRYRYAWGLARVARRRLPARPGPHYSRER